MKKCKGSFTLEATIVVSSILIVLFAVFYAFMLIYQNVVVSYAASHAASEGAKAWVENREGDDRYWRLKEFGTQTSGGRIDEIKKIAEECLEGGAISPDKSEVNVTFNNSFGMRKITVEVVQDLSVPFQSLAQFFNNGNPISLKAKASANVAEPMEYIRNIDYGVEWIFTLGNWVEEKINEKLKGNKAVETIRTLFGI